LYDFLLVRSRALYARAKGLPPVVDARVVIKDIQTPTVQNLLLQGTLFLPRGADAANKVPCVLIRTPYDRRNPMLGKNFCRIFAERGFAALVQDTRGRFGSGGDFFPVANEVVDGGATVDWLAAQDWCNGRIGTFGVSYLGLTAYASAGGAKTNAVKSIVPLMASARLYPILFHDGSSFALDLVLRWLWIVLDVMHSNPLSSLLKILTSSMQLERALSPAGHAVNGRDQALLGKELHFYQDLVTSTRPDDAYWSDKDVLHDMSRTAGQHVSILAGFHDFFVYQSLKDFAAAAKVESDLPVELTVGPWSHWDLRYIGSGIRLALDSFERHLRNGGGDSSINKARKLPGQPRPVRVNMFVMHSETPEHPRGRWLAFDEWPPRNTAVTPLFLASGGRLVGKYSGGEARTTHVYDPNDPTPHFGGPSFDPMNSGKVCQDALEARADVLSFTTSPMRVRTYVVGEVDATVHVHSSNAHTDLFLKLVHVAGIHGRAFNLTEKMLRLTPAMFDADGVAVIRVNVGAIAVMFEAGDACRLQVSGGAHPTYLRHHGTAEPVATATKLVGAKRAVLHDEAHPSCIHLPVWKADAHEL